MGLQIFGGASTAGTYRVIDSVKNRLDGITAATYLLGIPQTDAPQLASAGRAGHGCFYIDPADYAVTGKTTKYRVRAVALVNNAGANTSFHIGLYPVSAPAGASSTLSVTLGTVTAGSVVDFTTPLQNTITDANSGDFTAPAAGLYALAVVVDGAMAAASSVELRAFLQVRNV